jgi:hypothetical protein
VRTVGGRGLALACAGTLRLSDLLEAFQAPATLGKTKDLHGWVIGDLIPALQAYLAATGYRPETDQDTGDDEILVATGGRIWRIAPDWSAFEPIATYTAIGSGECFVLGALHALAAMDLGLPPRDMVGVALGAAASFDLGTAGPMHVVEVPA